jgi:hypothetical protein
MAIGSGEGSPRDPFDELVQIMGREKIYELVSSQVLKSYVRRVIVQTLAAVGLSAALIVTGAGYLLRQVPDAARAAKASLVKIQQDETQLNQAADAAEGAKKAALDKIHAISQQADRATTALGEQSSRIPVLKASIDKTQDQINTLASPGVARALESVAKASPDQLAALSNGIPKDSLLLSLGPCPSPWIPVEDARGAVLAAVTPKEKPGTKQPAKMSLSLTASNIPWLSLQNAKTQPATKLTVPVLKFESRKPDSNQRGYEISKCEGSCRDTSPFTGVAVQLDSVSVTGGVGNEVAKKAEVQQDQFRVSVCKLKT